MAFLFVGSFSKKWLVVASQPCRCFNSSTAMSFSLIVCAIDARVIRTHRQDVDGEQKDAMKHATYTDRKKIGIKYERPAELVMHCQRFGFDAVHLVRARTSFDSSSGSCFKHLLVGVGANFPAMLA